MLLGTTTHHLTTETKLDTKKVISHITIVHHLLAKGENVRGQKMTIQHY